MLEPGERCAGATGRRAGGDWADHDGTLGAATAERARGNSRCRGTSRAAIAILSHSALAVRTGIRRKSTADVRNVRLSPSPRSVCPWPNYLHQTVFRKFVKLAFVMNWLALYLELPISREM